MNNRNFSQRVLFYENYAKRDSSFLEFFVYLCVRDEQYWRKYEEYLRDKTKGNFVTPDRHVCTLRYVCTRKVKTGEFAFCPETRELAAEWLNAIKPNKCIINNNQ